MAPPSKNQVSLASDVSEIMTYFQNFRKLRELYKRVFWRFLGIFFFYEYLRCQRRILTPLSFSNGNVGRYASIVGYQFAQFSSLNDGDPRMMIFFMPIFSRPSHSCKHDGPVANSNLVTRQGYLVFMWRSHIFFIINIVLRNLVIWMKTWVLR